MDIVKQFMKIGGFKTPQDLEAYGEENFFRDFPEARKYAKGGATEAYPQTATFDNFFSYGVPPGPQYLKQGGSAYPQAQTEEQFFIPIYTDVYNPYNKAMGGSNVEMYPNAKTTPHWGPTNIFFQDGGEGQQEPEGLDRMGVLNTTGSFVANLKNKANQVNNKNAMMNAVSKYGFQEGGVQTTDDSGLIGPYKDGYRFAADSSTGDNTEQKSASTPSYLTKEDLDAWWKSVSQPQVPYYNVGPTGNMGNFLQDYFAYTTGNPFVGASTRGRISVDGQRAGNFYGNMPLIKAMMPELYGKGNFEDLMKNNADFRNRAEAMGLTAYEEPTGLKKLFGSRKYTFNQTVPYTQPNVKLDDADNTVKKYSNISTPVINVSPENIKNKQKAPLPPSPYEGVEFMLPSTIFNSNDREHRGAMLRSIIDGATPSSFDNFTPMNKFGGSYRQGDVVYMNDDEIAEFVKNGGQIEEMD